MTPSPTPPDSPPSRTSEAGLSSRAPRVLLVRLSAIGDVLHALPTAAALRSGRPKAVIDWVVEDRASALVEGHPLLDRVFVYPRKRWQRSLARPWLWPRTVGEVVAFVARLLSRRYDAVIDLQGNLKSGVVSLLSGAPLRLGFSTEAAREGNGLFTNRRVRIPDGAGHRVERNVALASALARVPLSPEPFILPTTPAQAAEAARAIRDAGLPESGYAILHAGTSGFGAFKRWPPDRFARLAERLVSDAGLTVAVTFGPGEEALAAEVKRAARVPVALLPTASLSALAEVVRRARVFVSADTGPLHVAAAVGTPLLGLYGPKDEAVYGPYGVPREGGRPRPLPTFSRKDVPCRPCTIRWCPDPVCMSGIEPDDVAARLSLVAGGAPSV